jgi:type II secretory pathway pseudopilin PulG
MNISMKVKEEWVEKGQAVLLVLLVIAIALGFGLSIISQSVSDVRISKQEQEASRAFNAAEAGIEEALKDIAGVGIGGSLLVDGIEVNYGVSSNTYISSSLKENESVEVDLTGADMALNTLSINWVDSNSQGENPGTCVASSGQAPASLLITVTDNLDQQAKYGVNSCALNTDNGMTDISDAGSSSFLRQYDVAVDANDVLVGIRPIYNKASISVTGNVDLPVQAYVINSTAQAPTLESKAIEVTRTDPATPSIFDYVLFSGTSIVK